jgi:hypothetical protein
MNAPSLSILPRLAAAAVIAGLSAMAGAMALSSPSQSATVDFDFNLILDGMSTGTCAGTICPTAFGTVAVTGDTTGTLDFSVVLGPDADVSFVAGDSFWFDLSDEGNGITFTLATPTSGTNGGDVWSWVTPSTGTFTPAPGADFPGPYSDLVTCTSTGPLCGTELNFTASGADGAHPFVIGAPLGAGPFLGIPVQFVANLSIAAGTSLCPESTACTGLVGTPELSTWAMMLLGFAGLGFLGYRKARQVTLAA